VSTPQTTGTYGFMPSFGELLLYCFGLCGIPVSYTHLQATIGQLVPNTNYYVVAAGSNTFQVSTTSGGSPLTLSNGGSTWTTTGGSLDNRGLMPSAPTLQALDFSHNVSANPSLGLPGYTANTVALAKLIIGFAYNAYRSDQMCIRDRGAQTVGYSNGSVQLSVPATSSISGTGLLSVSVNGSTISLGVPGTARSEDVYKRQSSHPPPPRLSPRRCHFA